MSKLTWKSERMLRRVDGASDLVGALEEEIRERERDLVSSPHRRDYIFVRDCHAEIEGAREAIEYLHQGTPYRK